MAPTGTPVQYIGEGGSIFAAVVTADHDEDTKNVVVFLWGNPCAGEFNEMERAKGFTVITSVLRGEQPGNWRPLPREGPEG